MAASRWRPHACRGWRLCSLAICVRLAFLHAASVTGAPQPAVRRYVLDGSWGLSSGGPQFLWEPLSFASHPGGGVVVADHGQYRQWLQRWNAAGRYLSLLPASGLWRRGQVAPGVNWVSGLTNVGVDGEGIVYAFDSGTFSVPAKRIVKLDPSGSFLLKWDLRDKGVTTGAISVAGSRVYVLMRTSIEVYSTNGTYLTTIGQGRLDDQPADMAVDGATGRVFVVDLGKGGEQDDAIKVFNATSGAQLPTWRLHFPCAVAVDPSGSGDVFVATFEPFKRGHFNITRYNRARRPLTTFNFTTPPTGSSDWIDSPIKIAVDWSSGAVYVLDTDKRVVRRLNPVWRVPPPRPPPVRRPTDFSPIRLARLNASCTNPDRWCTLSGVALAPGGSLVIAGNSEQTLVRLTPNGASYLPWLPASASPAERLGNLRGVGLDAANNTYAVVSSECNFYVNGWSGCSGSSQPPQTTFKVLKFGPKGAFVKEWNVVDLGGEGGAVAISRDRLYLVAKDMVAIYTLEGVFAGSLAPAIVVQPADLAVGPGGDLFVIDIDSSEGTIYFQGVKVLSPSGALKAAWPVADTAAGTTLGVDSIAVDPSSGDVWVGSRMQVACRTVPNSPNGCWRVSKFSPDGTARLAFEYGASFQRSIVCGTGCFDLAVDGQRGTLWMTDWDGRVSKYKIRA